MSDFYQSPPRLTNTFTSSRWLKNYLLWRLPKALHARVLGELERLGEKAAGPLFHLGRQAEREKPQHIPFDPWGKRIDEIRVSKAWNDLKDFSATEGMVADGYERRDKEFSRLIQFSKLFLFHPSSAFFTCPLAMTDGAARVLEIYGGESPQLREAFRRLTSRKPSDFWTSGQWMTERTGGSDVSHTSTVARPEGEAYRLSGVKWFSSATTAEMALALARIEGAPEGSRGLTLFYVPLRNAGGQMNGIEVLRLKDKLGTWALPTAELKLENCQAFPVGELQQGVKTVASMLNITRLYNSICSLGSMARGLELQQSYAQGRVTFGRPLAQQPLFVAGLFQQELIYTANFLLTFRMCELLGADEIGKTGTVESDLLRLFTPITKLSTAKSAVHLASETVEGFGGAGYIEDTSIPTLYRDAQVFSIWEGATNVLSLDLVRVLEKTSALNSFFTEAERILASAAVPDKDGFSKILRERIEHLKVCAGKFNAETLIANSRGLAFHLAHLYSALLWLEWSTADANMRDRLGAGLRHWLGTFGKFQFEPEGLTKDICQFFD